MLGHVHATCFGHHTCPPLAGLRMWTHPCCRHRVTCCLAPNTLGSIVGAADPPCPGRFAAAARMLLLPVLPAALSCGGDGEAIDLPVLVGKLQAAFTNTQQANLILAADLQVMERKQQNQVRPGCVGCGTKPQGYRTGLGTVWRCFGGMPRRQHSCQWIQTGSAGSEVIMARTWAGWLASANLHGGCALWPRLAAVSCVAV